MRTMRIAHALLALLLPAAISSVSSNEEPPREAAVPADSTVVAFWPRDADDTLSHARDPDGIVWLSSSSGRGFFGTVTSKFDTFVQTALHPLIQRIDIAWVPPVDAESTTFDQFFSHSPHLVAVHSVGIHVQVVPVFPIDGQTFLNEAKQREIEANVQNVLQDAISTSGVVPEFQAGFLANSLCNYRKWGNNSPMTSASDPSAASSVWCYTSSFSFPTTVPIATRGLPAFKRTDDATTLTTESPERESALGIYLRSKVPAFDYVSRVTQVTLEQSSSQYRLSTRVFEAWTADAHQIPISWQYDEHDGSKTAAHSLAVSSIRLDDAPSIEYLSLEQNGEAEMITKSSLMLPKNQFPGYVTPASVNVSIAGEGFHRRYSIDVDLHGAQRKCSESKLLLRVPLSHDVYADLDELRRMERFGELRLLAFSKHIEIERPSPVSPQHTIALEFPIASSDTVHIDFPIHFRYQAPSESDLYHLASIVSPEFFLYCPSSSRQSEPQVGQRDTDDSSAESLDAAYFQRWVLSSSRSDWQRLSVKSPIDVQDIAVPVGYLPHGPFVSIMTLSVASLGALLLVFIAVTTKTPPSASLSSLWKLKSA